MKTPTGMPLAKTAVLTIAEIKTVTEAFDRGEANVFDVMDAIIVAVEAYQAAASANPTRAARRRDAA